LQAETFVLAFNNLPNNPDAQQAALDQIRRAQETIGQRLSPTTYRLALIAAGFHAANGRPNRDTRSLIIRLAKIEKDYADTVWRL